MLALCAVFRAQTDLGKATACAGFLPGRGLPDRTASRSMPLFWQACVACLVMTTQVFDDVKRMFNAFPGSFSFPRLACRHSCKEHSRRRRKNCAAHPPHRWAAIGRAKPRRRASLAVPHQAPRPQLQFAGLKRIFEKSRESYYEALEASSQGCHEPFDLWCI